MTDQKGINFKTQKLRGAGRAVARSVFLFSLVLWVAAMSLYVRSKHHSDVVTIISPGHRCIVMESDRGLVGFGWQSPWPGPRLVSFSSSEPFGNSNPDVTRLLGPRFIWNADGNAPTFMEWKGLAYLHRTATLVYNAHMGISIAEAWRGLWRDETEESAIDVTQTYFDAPVWIPPVVLAIVPLWWMVTTGRTEWRQHRRRRKGLCPHCGYDLRESSSRCPECGSGITANAIQSRHWRVAFINVAIVLLSADIFVRWATADPDIPRRSPGDRIASDDKGVYRPWNFDSETAGPLQSALGDNGQFTVTVVSLPHERGAQTATVTISDADKPVYSWSDEQYTSFKIHGHVLYRVLPTTEQVPEAGISNWSPNGMITVQHSGGTVLAIDLKTGRELWRSALKDAPGAPNSTWVRFGFDVEADNLLIWGDELGGRYLEIKNLQTGKPIGHCFYEPPDRSKPPTNINVKGTGAVEEGKPYSVGLSADFGDWQGKAVYHWMIDWKDGPNGSSDIVKYPHPPGSDVPEANDLFHATELSGLIVTHTLPRGVASTVFQASVVDEIKGPFAAEPQVVVVIPSAPTDLQHCAKGAEIELTWKTTSGISHGAIVFISTDGKNFDALYEVDAGVDRYVVPNLKPATKYWFEVETDSVNGQSDPTPPISATTSPEH